MTRPAGHGAGFEPFQHRPAGQPGAQPSDRSSACSTAWAPSCPTCRRRRITRGRSTRLTAPIQRGYYLTAMQQGAAARPARRPGGADAHRQKCRLAGPRRSSRDREERSLLVRQGRRRRRCGGDVQICADPDGGRARAARQGRRPTTTCAGRPTAGNPSAQFNWAQLAHRPINPGPEGTEARAALLRESPPSRALPTPQYAVAQIYADACRTCRSRKEEARPRMARPRRARRLTTPPSSISASGSSTASDGPRDLRQGLSSG